MVGFLDKDASRVGERLVNPSIVEPMIQLFEIAERYRAYRCCLFRKMAYGVPVQTLLDMKAMGRDG